MFPQPCPQAINLYSTVRPQEWPARIDRELRRTWLAEKTVALQALTSEDKRVLDILAAKCPANSPNSIVRPYPPRPSWLDHVHVTNPVEFVTTHFGALPLAQGHRFGTDWKSGRWVIVIPAIENTLSFLAGLVHEVGHILSNTGEAEQNLRQMIRSEAMAMTLEEIFVAKVLEVSRVNTSEWHEYQRQIDAYNLFFFHAEDCLREGTTEDLLQTPYLFRESLWTSHGYQAAYAAASLIRADVLTRHLAQ